MKKRFFSVIIICVSLLLCGVCHAAPTAIGDAAFLMSDMTLGTSADSYVTTGELAAVSARLHSVLNSSGLSSEYDADAYLEYGEKNGLFSSQEYLDLSQPATRAQVALLLYNAVNGTVDLSETSSLADDYIPDADVSADYYAAAVALIEAGIIDAKDDYGAFKPGNNVKHYELSDMIYRIVGIEERISKKYLKYAGDQPFYLIDDFIMETPVVGINDIASGWRYDYTGSVQKGLSGIYGACLTDLSTDDNITISRTIEPQSDGVLQLDANYTLNYGFNGLYFQFLDSDGNVVYELGTRNNYYFYNGKNGSSTYISKANRAIKIEQGDPDYWTFNGRTPVRITLDLDEGTATAYVAGYKVGGTYKLGSIKDVAEFRITTGIAERLEAKINQVHLYKNWHMNDLMRASMPSKTPIGYSTSGNVKVEKIRSQADNQGDPWSAKITAGAGKKSYAKKSFKAISGQTVMEAYMLLPTGDDGAYFTVTSGGVPVIKIETKDNKFMCGDTALLGFSDNIWQLVRIEADTEKQTAKIKIRGKYIVGQDGTPAEFPFLAKAKHFDGFEIGITPEADCVMWFDDIEAYETFEYEDYCPEPVIVENDYYVGMSICNLWRNGSHYGWSYIQPHHEPITGFYDEGIPEEMDWEIKMLVEHGFDFYNFCWYSPQGTPTAPIKKSRMNDAIHEGFFNAKYSDKLKISLMFENASMRTAGTWDEFEENVWSYWKEWYFSDPRYFTIEEDGKTYTYLTIYQYLYFLQMCNDFPVLYSSGGLAIGQDSAEMKTALAVAADKLKWMSDDLVASGISDGLIVGFNNNLQTIEDAKNIAAMSAKIGLDYVGVFPYSWGTTSYNLGTQKAFIERGYENGQAHNIDLLALPCIGFNRIGWYHEEKFPLIDNQDLESLLEYLRDDYMTRFSTDGGSWKQKYIQFATWNEYGEGHYFYPSDDNGGYDYLNTMAEVLSGDMTGEENDTIPTQAQKDRIGHLYVGDRMHLRRNYDVAETMPDNMIDTLSFTFDLTKKSGVYSGWYLGNLTENNNKSACTNTEWYHKYLCRNGTSSSCTFNYDTELVSTGRDPMMYRKLSTPLKADDADVAYITMQVKQPYTTGEMFFISDHPELDDFNINSSGTRTYTQDYSYSFDILTTEKVTYTIDLNSHPGWIGNITDIRLDTGSINGNSIKVYEIRFAKYDDAAKQPNIVVDSVSYVPADYGEIRSFDRNEIYLAPADSENIHRLLHIVYDWPPERDVLTLDMPDGKIVKLTVGSDIAEVDGEQVKLEKAVELYDGIPVIPLIWLLKLGNYNYVYDFTNKLLDITFADKVIYHDIANFDAEGTDSSAFYTQNSNTSMTIVTDPYNSKNKVWQHNSSGPVGGVAQFNYVRTDFAFTPGMTYVIDFDARLCGTLSDGSAVSTASMAFNARYADTALSEGSYDHVPIETRVTLGTDWKHYSIEYTASDSLDEQSDFAHQISFYIDPYGAQNLGVDFQMDNLNVRTKPLPFKIVNGDAEGDETDAWYSANSVVTIETEENGNRYWHVEHDGESTSTWVYMRQHTKFEPGVTYYYSVDVRLREGYDGSVATTGIDINPRYRDLVQENIANVYDHNKDVTGDDGATFTTSDKWTTCKGSFTISMGYSEGGVNSGYDEITFFSSPVNNNTVGVSYDIDNFVVSTDFEEIFG